MIPQAGYKVRRLSINKICKEGAPHSHPALEIHEWDNRSCRWAIVNTKANISSSTPLRPAPQTNPRRRHHPRRRTCRRSQPGAWICEDLGCEDGNLVVRRRFSGQKRVIAVLRTAPRFPPPTRVDGTVSDGGGNMLPLPAGGKISEYLCRETRSTRFTENRINERSRCYAPLRNTTEHNGHPRMTEASTWEELVAATRGGQNLQNSREEKAGFGRWHTSGICPGEMRTGFLTEQTISVRLVHDSGAHIP
ncbi:hypothetical protein Hypma_002077 [Hypsizygus marmoreus]|uniref:Uncharacterized protein n=1 Tax=Hypsizygus marmoreus TaxID=39966 RepID=A0A369K5I4_HYPMA|nr:hypothetical protein Hypma_002077 [Hypsizygus marmoreus]